MENENRGKHFVDFNNGDLMMRMDDNMDMYSGELHIISGWSDDNEY